MPRTLTILSCGLLFASSPLGAATAPIRLTRPVDGPVISPFGKRFHPILHTSALHPGLDFGAPAGSPVQAAAEGKVLRVARNAELGNYVALSHTGNWSTLYTHLEAANVKAGQAVHQGETIATVGSSGHATGPHLHFELHKSGIAVDPQPYLAKSASTTPAAHGGPANP